MWKCHFFKGQIGKRPPKSCGCSVGEQGDLLLLHVIGEKGRQHSFGEEFGNIKRNTYFSLGYSNPTLGIHLRDTLIKTMKIHVYTSLLVVPIFVIKKKKTVYQYGNSKV